MKLITSALLFAFLSFTALTAIPALAQTPDQVLATATGHSFTIRDLSPAAQQAFSSLPTRVFATRSAMLDQMVNQRLLDAEAKTTGTAVGKLIATEKAKVAAPTEAAIKTVYDANRGALGDLTLEQARKQVVAYLRQEPEQNIITALFAKLKTKYKYAAGKAVNSADLAPTDVIATVNSKNITAQEYEDHAKIAIYELNADTSELIIDELNETIYDVLILDEAKSLNIEPGKLIANEITDKMKEFSNEERFGLQDALVKKLFAKYKVNILYNPPTPIVQNIAVDDDPAFGPVDAPVTVVMFSDFQCPACSSSHPILKKAIEMFPGKVRFVVRDYPLESIHENALKAAQAAGAANAQGKFFEYAELLYTHQNALDAASLKKYAADLGLNMKQFELDSSSEKTVAEIRKDIADGDAYIVTSTPTIFINGIRVRNLSLESFRSAIEKALK